MVIVVALALATYAWVVRVGYRPDEFDQVARQQIRMEEEEERLAAQGVTV